MLCEAPLGPDNQRLIETVEMALAMLTRKTGITAMDAVADLAEIAARLARLTAERDAALDEEHLSCCIKLEAAEHRLERVTNEADTLAERLEAAEREVERLTAELQTATDNWAHAGKIAGAAEALAERRGEALREIVATGWYSDGDRALYDSLVHIARAALADEAQG